MITETFVATTESVNKPSANLNSTLKDVGIFHYEFQPQITFRHGYKKSSSKPNCLAISAGHIFAAQADKAVIHVYNRERGNQEATVPLPERIHSLQYAEDVAILVIGTEDGKLMLWEIASGRVVTSTASHVEAVTALAITKNSDYIISGSADSNIHVWSIARLVSFSSSTQSDDDASSASGPICTFSRHREGITALAIGHSRTSTNFAVSTSSDRTCYLWHIETCQILRTFLTPDAILSVTLDPADRAVYLASNSGGIMSIDLTGHSTKGRARSVYDTSDVAPVQMKTSDYWSGQSSSLQYGAINCLTLSYDATNLLSGHTDGTIVRWDVANRRLVSDIAHLQQPVSSMQMLFPDALSDLRRHPRERYVIPTVTKPRLHLNAEATESKLGIPASYSYAIQVTQRTALSEPNPSSINDTASLLAGGLFPDSMLADAIEAMHAKNAGIVTGASSASATAAAEDEISLTTNKNDTYRIQSLEEDNALLTKKLAVMQRLYDDIQERHRQRSERRDRLGQQRREAYFAAKKEQKSNSGGREKPGEAERAGDRAMKPFESQIEAIDVESDEEELRHAAAVAESEKEHGKGTMTAHGGHGSAGGSEDNDDEMKE